MIPESEPPNIKAVFYGGHWDGTGVYFSGAYAKYEPTIPIKNEKGEIIHIYEKLTYILDYESLNSLPLIYRYGGSEKMKEL